jgi:NAD-dependent dihydropyrimidine dehydrogenase PreA subunit
MLREIITINEEKCTGCGLCIPNCPEGALQIIDGKARLVSDLLCDGLGACIGHCPEGAMKVEKKEAKAYDEKETMKNIVKHGDNTIKAHLTHLKDHNESELLAQAIEYLKENNLIVPDLEEKKEFQGCPGSRVMSFDEKIDLEEEGAKSSKLRQWPVQLHLVPPNAPYFQGKDVLLSADCVAYSVADFHKDFLDGKSLAIACPKLDSQQEIYKDKIISMIDDSKINSLTVMTMEVPCCSGLLALTKNVVSKAKRKVPLKSITISVEGKVLSEEWV